MNESLNGWMNEWNNQKSMAYVHGFAYNISMRFQLKSANIVCPISPDLAQKRCLKQAFRFCRFSLSFTPSIHSILNVNVNFVTTMRDIHQEPLLFVHNTVHIFLYISLSLTDGNEAHQTAKPPEEIFRIRKKNRAREIIRKRTRKDSPHAQSLSRRAHVVTFVLGILVYIVYYPR